MLSPESDHEAVRLLREEFPLFYKIVEGGISFPKGWYSLLTRLSQKISLCLKEHPEITLEVTQVKEKFGGLRFYWCLENAFDKPQVKEKISLMIQEAEERSFEICEICGQKGKKYFLCSKYSILCPNHTNA